MKQFVALSGLPRTGSTLLSSILSQNPEIHAEGNSAVCQLMWDMQQSVLNSEQIKASNKNVLDRLVKSIPSNYYANVTKPIVVDKCRSWSLLADGTEPIMRSLAGVEWARKNNNGEYLFVTYNELIDDTQVSLDRIYEHCGWQPFKHNLDNIVNYSFENDTIYGLKGQHDIRPQISRRMVDMQLSTELLTKCNTLDEKSNEQELQEWTPYELK